MLKCASIPGSAKLVWTNFKGAEKALVDNFGTVAGRRVGFKQGLIITFSVDL